VERARMLAEEFRFTRLGIDGKEMPGAPVRGRRSRLRGVPAAIHSKSIFYVVPELPRNHDFKTGFTMDVTEV